MIEVPWTPEDAIALEKTLKEEHMQHLLLILHLACMPSSQQVAEPGLDVKEIASQSHAFAQGQVKMLEIIDAHLPRPATKTIGKPFQAPKLKEPPDLRDPQ